MRQWLQHCYSWWPLLRFCVVLAVQTGPSVSSHYSAVHSERPRDSAQTILTGGWGGVFGGPVLSGIRTFSLTVTEQRDVDHISNLGMATSPTTEAGPGPSADPTSTVVSPLSHGAGQHTQPKATT